MAYKKITASTVEEIVAAYVRLRSVGRVGKELNFSPTTVAKYVKMHLDRDEVRKAWNREVLHRSLFSHIPLKKPVGERLCARCGVVLLKSKIAKGMCFRCYNYKRKRERKVQEWLAKKKSETA